MNVYLFNPDSDLALAHEAEQRRKGLPRAVYTAKPFAQRMARAMQLLPCWIASPGDAVLVEGDDSEIERWQRWADEHTPHVTVITRPPSGHDVNYRPWGWCNSIARRLIARGAAPEQLPLDGDNLLDADTLNAANRLTTVKIHRLVTERFGYELCPPPAVLRDDEHGLRSLRLALQTNEGFYLKRLYSGSGQGIYRQPPGNDNLMAEMWKWLKGEFKRLGAVMIEPYYNRLMDMGVEFVCEHDELKLDGYSLFTVDKHSQWCGTLVDSRQALHDSIAALYPDFDNVVEAVTQALREVIPARYNGHLGIDMLLYRRADGGVGINPCVELNLRATMGVVAAHMGERHGLRGTLRIAPDYGLLLDDTTILPPSPSKRRG